MKMVNRFRRAFGFHKGKSAAPLSRGRRHYTMAQVDRLTADFNPASFFGDQVVFNNLQIMRNRARDLERNNPYVVKFIAMARSNVIGSKGMRLQSLAAKAGNRQTARDRQMIEAAYIQFSKALNIDVAGRLDRRLIAQQSLQRIIVDGECLLRLYPGKGPHGLQIQSLDPDLLDHRLNRSRSSGRPEIRMGVELDPFGKPIAYHLIDPPPVGSLPAMPLRHTRVPAGEIIHRYRQERPGQTRGITWLAPVGIRANMLAQIEHAIDVGYRVGASKMGLLKRDENYDGPDDPPDVPEGVSPGEMWELPFGMSLETFDPGYPTADFAEFKKSVIREFASAFGISYPELGNDFQGVSYSAGQIGVQSDVAFWSDWQQFWIEGFEEPLYQKWLPRAITSGILPLPKGPLESYIAVRFQPPRRKHIDPLKIHSAQRIALGDLSRSPFDIAAENGADFEDVVEDYRRAKELLAAHGLPVPETWGTAFSTPSEGAS